MTKLLQESPVFVTCPDCGKVQHKKMKWMRGHKTLKCDKCKSRIALSGKAFKAQLAETVKAVKAFEETLMKLNKAALKSSKKPAGKKAGRKKPSTAKKQTRQRGEKRATRPTAGKPAAVATLPAVAPGG